MSQNRKRGRSSGREGGGGSGGKRKVQFREGAIRRLTMVNVLCYDNATFRPGPRLNVILGPNGSGKSTIACALGIVLGAELKYLRGSSDLSTFVQIGKQEAYVEVELHRKGGPLVVRRTFSKGSDRWSIGGQRVPKKEAARQIASLSIATDNLCLFLPQKRVQEFSALSPEALLEETERAIGGKLVSLHQELVGQGNRSINCQRTITQYATDLELETKKLEEMEADVEHLRQREQLLKDLEVLKKKGLWLEFDEARAKFDEAKKIADEKKAVLQNLAKIQTERRQELTQKEQRMEELKAQQGELRSQLKRADTKRLAQDKKQMELAEKCAALEDDLENVENKAATREKEIEAHQHSIAQLEAQIQNLPDQDAARIKLRELEEKRRALDQTIERLDKEVRRVSRAENERRMKLRDCQQRLRALEDNTAQRVRQLQRRDQGVVDVYRWLQQERVRLQGRVVGPLCLEISVKRAEALAYLEKALPRFTKVTFLTEAESAREQIARAGDGKGISIDVVRPGLQQEDVERDFPAPAPVDEELRSMGGLYWLSEVVEAPPMAMYGLLSLRRILQRTIVCDERAEQHIEKIQRHPGVQQIFTPNAHYTFNRERYGARRVISTRDALRRVNNPYLSRGVDESEKQRERARLEELQRELEQLKNEERQRTKERNEQVQLVKRVVAECKNMQDIDKTRRRFKQRIKKKQRLIEERMEENPEQEKRDLEEKLRRTAQARSKAVVKALEHMEAVVEKSVELDGVLVALVEVEARVRVLREQAAREDHEHDDVRESYRQAHRLAKELRAKASKLQRVARQKARKTPELEAQMEALPNTLPEIRAEILNLNARHEAMATEGQENLLQLYKECQERKEEMEQRLAQEQEEMDKISARIEALRNEWLEGDGTEENKGLAFYVAGLNKEFSSYMRRIGCKGEVKLRRGAPLAEEQAPGRAASQTQQSGRSSGTQQQQQQGSGGTTAAAAKAAAELEFDKWAIELRVKFKEDDMRTLSASSHSGGERSVCTMMYLIALQPFTAAPFRLVDEINQAMDPANERKVWDQVVDTVSGEGPQCFLLTPKLLPNLRFTDDMTVFVVMNGNFALTQKEWDKCIAKLLKP